MTMPEAIRAATEIQMISFILSAILAKSPAECKSTSGQGCCFDRTFDKIHQGRQRAGPKEAATMTASRFAIVVVAWSASLVTPLYAQWLDHPTPGIPRTADSKPNLRAPARCTLCGKPDLYEFLKKNS